MTRLAKLDTTPAREVVVSRVINASRELVWRAWTDPAHITHWWGPHGFRTTTREFDFRNGGTWRFTMHGPDGTDFLNRIIFEDIDKPNHLYYKHAGEGATADVVFEAVVTFEDASGKTRVTLRSIFPTAQERDFVVEKYGVIEGGHQTLERLEAFVLNSSSNDKKLTLSLPSDTAARFTRMFDAPRDLVWKAWTEPEHMQKWMTGPEGWAMEVLEHNFFVGGKWRYVWRKTNATEMEMWGIHKEIVAPQKHVATENWGVPWPESINHLVLSAEGKRTMMTLTVEYQSQQDRDNAIQTGMTDGMSVSFDRLDDLVANLR